MFAQGSHNIAGGEGLAAVHTIEQAANDFLSFVFAEILDESIKEVLTRHCVVDFALFVVILQLGEVHHTELSRIGALTVNLEHGLIGFERHTSISKGNTQVS